MFVRRKTEETQIAAGLAKPEQPRQHFHASGSVVRTARADPLSNFVQERVVSLALRRAKVARDHLFDLFRQLARDVGLAATEQKRTQAARETTLENGIWTRRRAPLHQRFLIALAKIAPRPEVAGRDEIHQ